MNEALFFLEIITLVVCTLVAMRHSKEALTTWIVLQGVFANLFVLKEISVFGFSVTPTDPFAVGAIFGLNLLQEVWGREGTKGILGIQTLAFLFVLVMGLFQTAFIPSSADTAHAAYAFILEPMPRILIASLVSLLIVQRFDLFFYGFLKSRLPLFWRNVVALAVSQTLDTCLFTFLGLFGLLSSPLDLIVLSLTVKGAIILTVSSFTRLSLVFLNGKNILPV